MVGVIGVKSNPYDLIGAMMHKMAQSTNLNGQEITYVFNNKQDKQYFEKSYTNDLVENRAEFLEELNFLSYDTLSSDCMEFLEMKNTETIFCVGGMDV